MPMRFAASIPTAYASCATADTGRPPPGNPPIIRARADARPVAGRARAFDEDAVAEAYGRWYASRPFDCGNTVAGRCRRRPRPPGPRRARPGGGEPHEPGERRPHRVSPLGVFGHASSPGQSPTGPARCILTHPHPACQDAGAVFTVAIAFAIRTGEAAGAVYEFARKWAETSRLDDEVRAWLSDAGRVNLTDFSTRWAG